MDTHKMSRAVREDLTRSAATIRKVFLAALDAPRPSRRWGARLLIAVWAHLWAWLVVLVLYALARWV